MCLHFSIEKRKISKRASRAPTPHALAEIDPADIATPAMEVANIRKSRTRCARGLARRHVMARYD
jgi:hypothetical protein